MKLLAPFLAIAALVLTLLPGSAGAYDYRIRPGDLLRIEVVEDSSIDREVLVAPDGRISVPLAGVLRVGGGTVEQARSLITAGLADDFSTTPTVTVSLLSVPEVRGPAAAQPLKIYVIGEVNRPGVMEVEPETTLLQALAMAGGFTDFAAVKRVQLRRKGAAQIYMLNYQKVLDGEIGVGAAPIAAGDTIVVPARRLFE
ncbi:polysaccharide biosynthesis/export family protein [Salipiger mangrovisoli]|uniref:Polysaccharide export protein n=1 Tax=Salipiger mangrovisoli TaxID=2865933 RepID=A0ABR9XAA2_9RHOB|nr:polysaccharide biosynthesis/export family protein [Salipiger mangrovisoli]MBE9640443.1 polysaccharide export protein [Salipiger mangrovisoli]